MRNEAGVCEAGCSLSDGLGGGGTGFCSKVDTEEPVIWLL